MNRAGGGSPVIETRGLTRRFGDLVAVDGIDLRVERGEVFGCLGPNGSGKSTLMRMLLGLLAPSAGTARVLGREIPRQAEALRSAVGYMTQSFSLYDDLTVAENVDFAAEVFGIGTRVRRARVVESLGQYGLVPFRSTRAGALSGGWRQRLALAAATVHGPELLVLDEPTAGVDPQSRRQFWEKLFELADAGATIFVSTHYMDEAVRCHRICVLLEGRRAAVGSPRDLAARLNGRLLDVHVAAPERAIAALAGSRLVASTTQLGDTVHVLLREDAPSAGRAAPELVRELQEAGLVEARAEPGAADLEDVFVALLRGERLDALPAQGSGVGPAASHEG